MMNIFQTCYQNLTTKKRANHYFFFNDTATTEIYTLSLHDALPICSTSAFTVSSRRPRRWRTAVAIPSPSRIRPRRRSEEHTSELQSRSDLVCRLLLEKKKIQTPSGLDFQYQDRCDCNLL